MADTLPRLAIIVHAFYPDIFAGLVRRLDGLSVGFRLYVSTPEGGRKELERVLAGHGFSSEIYEFENRGRDISPFLQIMPRVIGENFDFVLKLHTKKSAHFPRGEAWRDELYDYLLDDSELQRNLEIMERDPSIGIVTHPGYVVTMHTSWRPNERRIRELAARLGQGVDVDNDAFSAGSMFLARASAIEPLLDLSITPDEFELERGQKDATLAHAIERAFTYSAKARGLELAGSRDTTALMANYRKFGGKLWTLRLRRLFRKITPS